MYSVRQAGAAAAPYPAGAEAAAPPYCACWALRRWRLRSSEAYCESAGLLSARPAREMTRTN